MKFLCVLLIPAVLAAVPSKRVLFDTFLNSQEATHLIDQLVESLATNDNEAKCEQECHVLITNQDSVFQHLCPFMCHSAMQALGNLHSPNTDPTAGKRMLLDSFLNTQETSKIIDQLVTTLSSDTTEVACEKECHILIADSTSVFQHMCPFLCHSAQAIVGNLHHSSAPASPAKRLVLGNFINTQETSNIIDQLVATLSSDSSEVACEKECHILITDSTSVFQHMCPFLCHSAQAIIGNLHHTTAAPVQKKRFLVDTLLANPEVNVLVTSLVAVLGSDPTEQTCEKECVVLMHADSVMHHLCPFVCHSFQQLVSKVHLTSSPSNPSKRFLVDTLLSNPEISVLVSGLVATLGSDPTEQACESQCVTMIHADNFLHHLCPFVCHSFQELVHNVHLTPSVSNPVHKRFLIDSLLNNPEVSVIVNSLVSTLGSDPTEAACESQCTNIVHADNVVHFLCPLVCHSFQSLVQKVHLSSPMGNPAQ
ncbi:uncharacterized protein LOC128164254 isoform X1 [Crassostrea angulata]|uniref:uncharacterized protein LOC128164254 isoform X1 n=1 Tax=Magallana angulata TaxID=2784310 RepID=UPI0022B21408|nr:uncharacterized protein LOC128164254 isoform X1 [Crassostrea angulata]